MGQGFHRWTITRALWLGVAMSIGGPAASAQALRDPMRPPTAAGDPGGQATAAPSAATGLQLVRISRARKEATIDGRTLRLGEKLGDATLIEVTDVTATLRSADGDRIVLHMFPDADKRAPGRGGPK